jgi:adenosylcobinamide-phosphate synthase
LNVLLVAIAIDALIGEPPSRVHPVVAMGNALSFVERHAPSAESARFVYGLLSAIGLPLLWALGGRLAERFAPWPVQAILLKSALSGRALLLAGAQVENSLRAGDLAHAKRDLRALVSRPTEELNEPLIAAAAIESLAENLVDSWIAPLLAYTTCGLGGAYFYRSANTADAMWGYRTPEYEWLGKAAARLDDVLNWIPARIGAALLIVCGQHVSEALQVFVRDRDRTSSPNAGQSMSACAGQLGVRLEKVDHYVLNVDGRPPTVHDMAAMRHLVFRAMLGSVLLAGLLRR